MMVTWYSKSMNDISPAYHALIHLTEFGNFTLCDKKIKSNGRWIIKETWQLLKTVDCRECLKFAQDNGLYIGQNDKEV